MLPKKFEEQMKALLKNDYDSFIASMDKPSVKGLRINRTKASPEIVTSELQGDIEKLSYGEECYKILCDTEGFGNTPLHRAGAFYIQDPGAMAALASAAHVIKEGMRAADLCAAPGGKTTQLSSLIGNKGFLLANEYVPKRAKILLGNIERLGITNTVISSLDTSELSKDYKGFFHFVLADAPCSGEGMFRKGDIAKEEWSTEGIVNCVSRQMQILDNAAEMVAEGGYLLYSTCTYNIEENEKQLDAFLTRHPSFSLIPAAEQVIPLTADGIIPDGSSRTELKLCRRFYPHISEGEGQFVALMRRAGELDISAKPQKNEKKKGEKPSPVPPPVLAFLEENLTKFPDGVIKMHGDNAVLHLHGVPLPKRNVFLSGILLGEVSGKNLFPSYQLFSALGHLFKRKLELSYDNALKYLKGEELECLDLEMRGYAAICYKGVVLGGGKISDGRVKNHYPKGLRTN